MNRAITFLFLLLARQLYGQIREIPVPQVRKGYKPSYYNANFPGGRDSLDLFVNKYRDPSVFIPDSINYSNDSFYIQYVHFDIDSFGHVGKPETGILEGLEFVQKDINNIVSKMPLWEPGYRFTDKKCTKKKLDNSYGSIEIKYYYYSKHPSVHPNSLCVDASFPGGEQEMEKFIERNRNANYVIPAIDNFFNDSEHYVSVYVTIEEDGTLYIPKKRPGEDKFYEVEIYSILKKMPKWNPAYEWDLKSGIIKYRSMYRDISMRYYYAGKKPRKK